MEYASRGTAGAALGTGIAGLTLGVLNGAGGLLGMSGYGNGWNNNCGWNGGGYVTRDALELSMRLAAKDSELATVRSEQDSEIKMADIYERLSRRINEVEKAQEHVNREQAVYNGINNSTVTMLRSQVDQLMGLTALHIPMRNICPEPMARYNTWEAPTTP